MTDACFYWLIALFVAQWGLCQSSLVTPYHKNVTSIFKLEYTFDGDKVKLIIVFICFFVPAIVVEYCVCVCVCVCVCISWHYGIVVEVL